MSDLEATTKNSKIGWGLMLKNRHSFFAIMIALIGTFDIMFFKGFLSIELVERDFGEDSGLIMALPAFTYLLGCLLIPYTCEHTSRKFLFLLSMFGSAGCILLLGPSKILNFPDSVFLVIIS